MEENPIFVDQRGNPHDDVPDCKDCAYFIPVQYGYIFRPALCKRFYTADQFRLELSEARNNDRLCGPEGKYFKPKPEMPQPEMPQRKSFLKKIFGK